MFQLLNVDIQKICDRDMVIVESQYKFIMSVFNFQ